LDKIGHLARPPGPVENPASLGAHASDTWMPMVKQFQGLYVKSGRHADTIVIKDQERAGDMETLPQRPIFGKARDVRWATAAPAMLNTASQPLEQGVLIQSRGHGLVERSTAQQQQGKPCIRCVERQRFSHVESNRRHSRHP
jgi:hypothetical protein